MDGQLRLPLHPLQPYITSLNDCIGARFLAFHLANPHVVVALIKLALDIQALGRARWAINGAFEVLRWSAMRSHGEEYKLNNNFRALYARLIPLLEPALVDFFDTREQQEAFDLEPLVTQIQNQGGWRALAPDEE